MPPNQSYPLKWLIICPLIHSSYLTINRGRSDEEALAPLPLPPYCPRSHHEVLYKFYSHIRRGRKRKKEEKEKIEEEGDDEDWCKPTQQTPLSTLKAYFGTWSMDEASIKTNCFLEYIKGCVCMYLCVGVSINVNFTRWRVKELKNRYKMSFK